MKTICPQPITNISRKQTLDAGGGAGHDDDGHISLCTSPNTIGDAQYWPTFMGNQSQGLPHSNNGVRKLRQKKRSREQQQVGRRDRRKMRWSVGAYIYSS